MDLIIDLEQIIDNLSELEKSRKGSFEGNEEYKSLVANGNCFFPYMLEGSISFAPSRFIGYADNNFSRHHRNSTKSGTKTNSAISKALGIRPVANPMLEQAYIDFCKRIATKPSSKTGRKYWATDDIRIFIERDIEDAIANDANIRETTRRQLILARIGQGVFKKQLIKFWGKCVISSCSLTSILRASHIKPWSVSSNKERLSVYNGILLSPNLDVLFDKGFISFDSGGNMLISKELPATEREALGCPETAKISLLPEHEEFMEWHRTEKFIR